MTAVLERLAADTPDLVGITDITIDELLEVIAESCIECGKGRFFPGYTVACDDLAAHLRSPQVRAAYEIKFGVRHVRQAQGS